MKNLIIDGRIQRVFVLLETDERIVYIPLNGIHRVDYRRLLDIEEKAGDKNDMLEIMKNYTIPENNRNALVQFEGIIQVMKKNDNNKGERVKKPDEVRYKGDPQKEWTQRMERKQEDGDDAAREAMLNKLNEQDQAQETTKKKRGPGRPPKNSQ